MNNTRGRARTKSSMPDAELELNELFMTQS